MQVNLQFYVPMYRFENQRLVEVQYKDFRSSLLKVLQSEGVLSVQSELCKKIVEGYVFNEEMLIVTCSSVVEPILVKKYIDLLIKYHKNFQHNFYVYGRNGLNHTICILNKNAKII